MSKICVTRKVPMSETALRFLSDKNRSRMFLEAISAEDGRSEFEIDGWKLKCIGTVTLYSSQKEATLRRGFFQQLLSFFTSN